MPVFENRAAARSHTIRLALLLAAFVVPTLSGSANSQRSRTAWPPEPDSAEPRKVEDVLRGKAIKCVMDQHTYIGRDALFFSRDDVMTVVNSKGGNVMRNKTDKRHITLSGFTWKANERPHFQRLGHVWMDWRWVPT